VEVVPWVGAAPLAVEVVVEGMLPVEERVRVRLVVEGMLRVEVLGTLRCKVPHILPRLNPVDNIPSM